MTGGGVLSAVMNPSLPRTLQELEKTLWPADEIDAAVCLSDALASDRGALPTSRERLALARKVSPSCPWSSRTTQGTNRRRYETSRPPNRDPSSRPPAQALAAAFELTLAVATPAATDPHTTHTTTDLTRACRTTTASADSPVPRTAGSYRLARPRLPRSFQLVVARRYVSTASTRRWSSSVVGSPSLPKMLEMCFSTAPRVTTNSRAMAALLRPCATSSSV
jgi:hypothetical protein